MSNTVKTGSLEAYLTSGDSIRIQPNTWFTKYYTCTQDKYTNKPEEANKYPWECMRGHLESYTNTEKTTNLLIDHKIVSVSLFTTNKKEAIAKKVEGTVIFPFEK